MTAIQETIIKAMQSGSWFTFFIVFWSGAILSMSSCTIIRMPVIIGYVGGMSTSKRKAMLITSSFALGLVLSYTLLGVIFTVVSSVMHNMIRWSRYFYCFIGLLALFIGIQLAGLVDLDFFGIEKKKKALEPRRGGLLGAFIFGFVFAIFEAPVCPCCGPVLFIMAGFAKNNIPYALFLFFTYALGQSFPILLIGSFTSVVKYMSPKIAKTESVLKIISGNILIAIAIYFFIVG